MDKDHTYIKCINLSHKKFDEISNYMCLRYLKLKDKARVSFSMFKRGILFAHILGNLTARGDKEALYIFSSVLGNNDIPEIKIIKEKNNVKICMSITTDKQICSKSIR